VITKRLIGRANKLDAVNILIKHITSVVCAFLAAAAPLNIVKTFALSGICLVGDAGTLFCTIRPDRAKRLLLPLPSAFPDISDVTVEDELKFSLKNARISSDPSNQQMISKGSSDNFFFFIVFSESSL
jgi:hypothetical protein